MRAMCLVVLLAAVLASAPAAQPADSFVVYTYVSTATPPSVYQVADSGAVTRTLATLATGTILQDVVMAEDNASFRAIGYYFQSPTYAGLILDVSPAGAVRTLCSGPPLFRPFAMVQDCDGGWIVLNVGQATTSVELYRLRGTTLTTLSMAPNVYGYAAAVDEDSGQIVVRGMTRTTPYKYGYFRIDPASGTVTEFSVYQQTSASIYYGAHEMHFEGNTGAFIDGYYDATASVTRVIRAHPEIGIAPFPGTGIRAYPADIVAAGQRTPGIAYYSLARTLTSPYTYEVFRLQADGSSAGSAPLQGITPYARSSLLRVGSRNLAWSLDTPPNGRSLVLDFPGEAGRNYYVGLSLAGVRPGPVLGDGREIPLIPDLLTVLSLTGRVPGVLENTVGVLDGQGRGRAKIDTNAFGSALKGLRIWVAVVVTDSQAPAGVAHVAGPKFLAIRQ